MNKKTETSLVSSKSLALNNTGLPPTNKVQLTISIANNGFVKFGTFFTKNLQFRGDFRKGIRDNLSAIPAVGFQFDHWQVKLSNPDVFAFVTDKQSTSITPFEDMEIRAIFIPIDA